MSTTAFDWSGYEEEIRRLIEERRRRRAEADPSSPENAARRRAAASERSRENLERLYPGRAAAGVQEELRTRGTAEPAPGPVPVSLPRRALEGAADVAVPAAGQALEAGARAFQAGGAAMGRALAAPERLLSGQGSLDDLLGLASLGTVPGAYQMPQALLEAFRAPAEQPGAAVPPPPPSRTESLLSALSAPMAVPGQMLLGPSAAVLDQPGASFADDLVRAVQGVGTGAAAGLEHAADRFAGGLAGAVFPETMAGAAPPELSPTGGEQIAGALDWPPEAGAALDVGAELAAPFLPKMTLRGLERLAGSRTGTRSAPPERPTWDAEGEVVPDRPALGAAPEEIPVDPLEEFLRRQAAGGYALEGGPRAAGELPQEPGPAGLLPPGRPLEVPQLPLGPEGLGGVRVHPRTAAWDRQAQQQQAAVAAAEAQRAAVQAALERELRANAVGERSLPPAAPGGELGAPRGPAGLLPAWPDAPVPLGAEGRAGTFRHLDLADLVASALQELPEVPQAPPAAPPVPRPFVPRAPAPPVAAAPRAAGPWHPAERSYLEQLGWRPDELSTDVGRRYIQEGTLNIDALVGEFVPEQGNRPLRAGETASETAATGELGGEAPRRLARVPTAVIRTAPEALQYKAGSGEGGRTGTLQGVSRWEDDLAGKLLLWRDTAGQLGDPGLTYVVNGHERLAKARELGVREVDARYIDAPDAPTARVIGALSNIVDDKGSVLDAAKVFRDLGGARADLAQQFTLPVKSRTYRVGLGLSKLSGPLFNAVVQGKLGEERGALIGERLPSPQDQEAFAALLNRHKGSITDDVVRELADLAAGAPTRPTDQPDLFGSRQEETLAVERAQVQAAIRQRLSRERRLLGAVSKKGAQETLASAGNVIDVDSSRAQAQRAGEALEVFDKLKAYAGPIREAVDAAARTMGAGGKRDAAVRAAYEVALREVDAALGRAGAGGAGGPAPAAGGAGAGVGHPPGEHRGAAAEAPPPAQGGPEEPGLGFDFGGGEPGAGKKPGGGRTSYRDASLLDLILDGLLPRFDQTRLGANLGGAEFSSPRQQAARAELFRRGAKTARELADQIARERPGIPAPQALAAATRFFKEAGFSPDGFDVASATKAEGGSPAQARRQVEFAAATEGRDVRKTPIDALNEEVHRAAGGEGPPSPPENPLVPAPLSAEPRGPLADTARQQVERLYPGWAKTPVLNLVAPMPLGVARSVPGRDLVDLVRRVEDERRVVASTFLRGGNPAGTRLGMPAALPGFEQVRELIPTRYRARAFAAAVEGPTAPPGMRLEDVLPDPAERAQALRDLEPAVRLFEQITQAEAGLNASPAVRPRYWRRLFDRDELVKGLEGELAHHRAQPRTQQIDAVIRWLEDKVAGIRERPDQYLISGDVELPAAMWYGPHEARLANLPYYITDFDTHTRLFAHQAARKFVEDRHRPRVLELFGRLQEGALVEESAPPLLSRAGLAGGRRTLRVTPEYRELVSQYVANAFGYADRGNLTRAELAHAFQDGLSIANADQALTTGTINRVGSALQMMSYQLLINWNPGFLLNRLQALYNVAPMVGERRYLAAEAAVKRDLARRAGGRRGDPVVQALRQELGLDMLDMRHFVDPTSWSGRGARALEFTAATRTELGNHLVAGHARYQMFTDLVGLVGRVAARQRAQRNGVLTRSVLEQETLAEARRGPGRALFDDRFVDDRYRPPQDQVAAAVSAYLDGTAHQSALLEAQRFMKDSIFHYGRSERPLGQVQGGTPAQTAFQFQSYFGKETNLFWSRLNWKGKARFLLYPLLIGGAKAVPLVGLLAGAIPQVDEFINDLEDGVYGNHLRFIFRFNLARGVFGSTVPAMANPLGKFVPGFAPEFGRAQTETGRRAQAVASAFGPGFSSLGQAGIPVAEALVVAGAGPAWTAGKKAAAHLTPFLRNAHAALRKPGLSPAEKAQALIGLRPEREEKAYADAARTRRDVELAALKRDLLREHLVATDVDHATMADALGQTPKELEASLVNSGLQTDARAARAQRVRDLESIEDAENGLEAHALRAREGDQNALTFIHLWAPEALEKFRDAEETATTPERRAAARAAILHAQELMREFPGPYELRRHTRVDRRPAPATRWIEHRLRQIPAGTSAEDIRRRLMAAAPPPLRREVHGLLTAYEQRGKLEAYHERLLTPVTTPPAGGP